MTAKLEFDDSQLDWEKGQGLLPAIVQHAITGKVLMLAYMNESALEQTLDSGFVTFYSRSRKRLWQKGEISGNVLSLIAIDADCDGDTLLIQAQPAGPVCHLETPTCFGDQAWPKHAFLAELEQIILQRKNADSETSYTARLLAGPIKRMAQKVGEEGVETALAAVAGDRDDLLSEAADLMYHLQVLLVSAGADLNSLTDTLQQRHQAETAAP